MVSVVVPMIVTMFTPGTISGPGMGFLWFFSRFFNWSLGRSLSTGFRPTRSFSFARFNGRGDLCRRPGCFFLWGRRGIFTRGRRGFDWDLYFKKPRGQKNILLNPFCQLFCYQPCLSKAVMPTTRRKKFLGDITNGRRPLVTYPVKKPGKGITGRG